MRETILEVNNIRKKYSGHLVLDKLSFSLAKGEIYGLVGQNGAGKTTLLRILMEQISSYTGEVKKQTNQVRMGAVINSPALFLNMSADQNLRLHATLLGIQNKSKVTNVLKTVGLEHTGRKKVEKFSLGMIQRLKLAQVLLEDSDILILDEPTNGLDPNGIAELRGLIIRLNQEEGKTIVIASHILSEIESIATTIGIISEGKIVFQAPMQEVLEKGKSLEELYRNYARGGDCR